MCTIPRTMLRVSILSSFVFAVLMGGAPLDFCTHLVSIHDLQARKLAQPPSVIKGHHYMIDGAGQSLMFDPSTKNLVAQLDAP